MAERPKKKQREGEKDDTFQKLDEAYAESSLEEQLFVYWNRYKNQASLLLIAAVFLVVGIQGSKWWSAKSITDRGDAYTAAVDDSQREAFADDNSGNELGGVAYLELADKSYEDQNFERSATFYEKAFKAFDLVAFKQRAHLGIAISRLKAGQIDESIKDLEAISLQEDYPDVAKSEALYHLSILDWENGAFESMLEKHETIQGIPNAGSWRIKVLELQNSIPELKVLADAKSTEGTIVEDLQVLPSN
tara:strand:+ start:4182 stop:4925 length:744 start_codon:yes stop_codon:yes gene_type:complete